MNNRGGKRPGAGRPKKAETVVISFRVEKERAMSLKEQINRIIKPV